VSSVARLYALGTRMARVKLYLDTDFCFFPLLGIYAVQRLSTTA